ncbi:MAG: hypothetical protein RBS55_01400 [Bacteroidales bacterium]|jgi:hypothetical protein|nr:hypothetical protein [Bacteroidales bacterium]
MKKIHLLYIVPLVLLAACKPNIDEFAPSKGNADFSSFVAVGDSWTSGFADGSLYISGQEYSFPNIMNGQFKKAGGGDFLQPLMLDEYGIGLATGIPKPKLEMGFHPDCKGVIGLVPAYADVAVNMDNLNPLNTGIHYDNISTPGLKTFYMGVEGMNQLNPYYKRFASEGAATMNSEIALAAPTFFSLWLGSYDALAYAIAGGADPMNPVTTKEVFAGSLQQTLAALTATGAKGVMANIPDVTDFPFFHTIPYNALPLDQASADALNAGYAQVNAIIKGLGRTDTIHFKSGANAVIIADATLPWGFRQVKPSEFLLLSLPQDSLKCAGWGSQKPIPGQFVLDEAEIAITKNAVDEYNSQINLLIKDLPDVALVNMYTIMKEITETGLVFNHVNVNAGFVTGNFYSTDGLNPTPMGSAVIAHYFIKTINESFQANIPQVIVSEFPAVKLP